MFFRKKNKIEKHAKKLDKLITGIIIGGAVASIFGLSKTTKGQQITKNLTETGTVVAKKSYNIFGKVLVKVISTFDKDKK